MTDREALVAVAKLWKGHEGVNYDTTTPEMLFLLIKDAVEGDQEEGPEKL